MRKSVDSKDNAVAAYYQRFGSWAGYNLVMGRSQHAGYWTETTKNERQAQANYMKQLAKILDLQPDEQVLDAGSGQGFAARYLAESTGAKITGITITPREVRVSEKLSRKTYNRPSFVLGDYTETDFADDHFDVVYTTETLSHVIDIEKAMREFYRILKPGGRLVLADYEIDSQASSPDQHQLHQFLKSHAGGHGISQQNPGHISASMKKAGFVGTHEIDWTKYTKPSYDRLRRIAKPFAWIKPSSKLAPYFVNAVMASHGYSNMYEAGVFRYIVYSAQKPGEKHV